MTAPSPTILHVPAGVGIDQSVRAEHVQPGQANLYQESVRLTRQGSLEKCPGYTALSSAVPEMGSRTSGLRIAAYRDSIVVSDGDLLGNYSPAAGRWSLSGRLPGCRATLKAFSSTSMPDIGAHLLDIAYSATANMYAVASLEMSDTESGYKFPIVRIVDGTTLKQIKSVNLEAGTVGLGFLDDLRLAVIGNHLVAIYTKSVASVIDLYGTRMDLTDIDGGFATAVNLSDGDYGGVGAALHALPDRMAVAYGNQQGGTSRITTMTIDHTSDSLTTIDEVAESTNNDFMAGIALAGTEELWTVWGYLATGTIHATARGTDLSSIISVADVMTVNSAGVISVTAGRSGESTIYIAASSADDVPGWLYTSTKCLQNASGTLIESNETAYIGGWTPASAPFSAGNRVYLELAYDDTEGDIRNTVLVDITANTSPVGIDRNQTVRPVAWLAPRANSNNIATYTSGYDGPRNGRHVAQVSSSVYASVHLVRASAVTTSLAISKYDFGSSLRHLPLAYGDNLFLSGNLLVQFDGERVYENGFIVPPRLALTSDGSGLTGTFGYTAIHEYTDALGNVVWSAPAPVQSITLADEGVSIQVRRPSVTWKEGYDGDTRLEPQGLRRTKTKVFRTLSTGTGDFYLLATIQTSPSDGVITITDSAADDTISSNAKLYKTPGIVGTAKDRQSVGSCLHATECSGVLVVVDADGSTLRAFAQRVVGESPWHHDSLQMPVDGDGEVTALASLDGALIVFKRGDIYVVPVEPASDNVSVGGFGSPRRIAVDVGCVDPRSVVVTGEGVFFQSDRGIELLTRSLTIDPIGNLIQDTYADYPNVTAAVLDVRAGLVRFSLAQADSDTIGVDAVYDLIAKKWVSFDNKAGEADYAQAVSAAYAYHAGAYRYVWLDSIGTVRYENDATYLHDGTWRSGFWETPWLKLELQREHQMWQAALLFERHSAAGLVAEVAYDYADYDSADDKVWTEAEIATYDRQVELRVTGRQTAVKFRFHDTVPVTPGTGQGLEFIGLSLDLAPHQGPTQGTPRLAVGSRK